MSDLHDTATDAVMAMVSAPDDPELQAMDARAEREGFPTVGPAVGRFLRLLVHACDVRRIFECGSGFGYSAYWMASALPPDGEIVLTELDAAELDDARESFAAGGITDRARFEHGDAIELLRQDGTTYDLILIDHEKAQYPAGFEAARDRVAPGGLILADNACTTATYDAEDVLEALRAEDGRPPDHEAVAGVVEYYRRVTADPAFETSLLPLGEGVLAAVKRGER